MAGERDIRRFIAEALPGRRLHPAAQLHRRRVRLEFDLEPTEQPVAVMRAREQRAEAQSVRH